MHIVMVQFHVKEESLDAFLEASKDDGRGSVSHEYGCRRFDIIQDSETPTRIAFCEVYDDQAAFEAHPLSPASNSEDSGRAIATTLRLNALVSRTGLVSLSPTAYPSERCCRLAEPDTLLIHSFRVNGGGEYAHRDGSVPREGGELGRFP